LLTARIDADAMTLNAPILRRLYEDWKAQRHSRIPRRADFDPAALRYILGSLSLVEVWRDPLRFRARVHGTWLAQRLGFELTGKFFDQAPPSKYIRLVTEHFADVVAHERPSFAWLVNEAVHPPAWENESLVLPLSRDGDSVDFLFAAVVNRSPFSPNELTDPYNRLAALPG
jgi:hypothetical protein